MMKKIRYILPAFILIFFSCGKDENWNTIPAEPVHFEISLIKSPDKELRTPGNVITFTRPRLSTDRIGYSGLLVICSGVPITAGAFQLYAYDLCCPHEKQRQIKVSPQSDGTAKCTQCGSVYEIFNGVGNVKSGPSKDNLQIYYTTFSNTGDGIFLITRRN
jgi:hypothetical protein